MAITVIDSTNQEAILAEAGIIIDGDKKDDAKHEGVAKSNDAGKDGAESKAEAAKTDSNKDKEDHKEDDDEDENGLTPEQKEALTRSMKKAIGKKHRMLKEAEEFAAAQYNEKRMLEQKLREAEEKLAQTSRQEAPKEEKTAKPDRMDFTTESEYIDAMIKYGITEGLREKDEEQRRRAEIEERNKIINAASERIEKAKELVPDFVEILEDAKYMTPQLILDYMYESEKTAELVYYLAKNPDIIESLTKLSPKDQLVKIVKIELNLKPFGAENQESSSKDDPNVGLSKDTELSPSKTRNDAPVIKPLDGTGSAGSIKSDDTNIRDAIAAYSKRNQVNLNIRKRH